MQGQNRGFQSEDEFDCSPPSYRFLTFSVKICATEQAEKHRNIIHFRYSLRAELGYEIQSTLS